MPAAQIMPVAPASAAAETLASSPKSNWRHRSLSVGGRCDSSDGEEDEQNPSVATNNNNGVDVDVDVDGSQVAREFFGSRTRRFRKIDEATKEMAVLGLHHRTASGNHIIVPESPCIGIDMGGTMCKICYLEKDETPSDTEADIEFRRRLKEVINMKEAYGETGVRDQRLEFDSKLLKGHVYLAQFQTRKMGKFLDMCKENQIVTPTTVIKGTGGGAKKYGAKIKELLNVTIQHCDELQCLISGINFMIQQSEDALYTVDYRTFKDNEVRLRPKGASFPYLLVNIGSGVSILRINEDGSHERVGGTSLGGSTFYGLCCIVTGCSTFEDAMAFAEKGDARNIDLLVQDIYGGDYEEYDLSGDTVASSLGKLVQPEVRERACSEDVARAILDMITNNIGSLALLHAKAHGTSRIIFAGNFLRGNKISVARLSYAMEYWSHGLRHATFLKHEGYMGSIGAMLMEREMLLGGDPVDASAKPTSGISYRSSTPTD